ncbi:SDR family oxidoreductase [Bacillus sp. FJAT-29814]|uniref:SDR family oxidoreductase n=1 Tax=Bacillus sp. FJAT-29814 TaxID=1729688 RepID=UPI00083072E2|nr:SDR family oxidoreductase [Bacillus sp. FJAT-29814]
MYNVLVTGGGKGLGAAISKTFASHDFHVFINYLRDRDSAVEVEHSITSNGGKAEIIQADVGKKEDIDSMMAQLPPIDIIVHNAVYPISANAESISQTDWERGLSVSASGLLYIAQKTFPGMKERGYGRIFAISSSGAKRGIPSYLGVGVGKAAMEALIRYFATEWGKYGISANVVSPGAIYSDAFQAVFQNAKERFDVIKKRTPRKETVNPMDVGEMLVQLSRQEMRMVTGQTICMDGGYTLLT